MASQTAQLPTQGESIYFFDGTCNLCNRGTDSLLRRMKRKGARTALFAPLQGETAKQLLPPESLQQLDTMVWMESPYQPHTTHYRSAAVLRAFASLGGPWKLLRIGLLLPAFMRDPAYRLIARNRYAWWGKRHACRIPTPEEQAYFLP